MVLQEETLRRLSIIKYLFRLACDQSREAEIPAALSLLSFHTAAELFLYLAAEHVDALGKSELTFMDYWGVVNPKLPAGVSLGQKELMRRLNTARGALKHRGNLPSKHDVEAFRAGTALFFEESCQNVLGIDFQSISLAELVALKPARLALRTAESLLENGKYKESAEHSSLAFDNLLKDYETRKSDDFRESPFRVLDRHGLPSHRFGASPLGPSADSLLTSDLRDFSREVFSVIRALDERVRILALGIDFRQYTRFRMLAPGVRWSMGSDEPSFSWPGNAVDSVDQETCEFIEGFVIDVALQLLEFDLVVAGA